MLPRIAGSPAPTVAEVLLDQAVACGIGNVYKAEALFVRRTSPFAPPVAYAPDAWRALYGEARAMMLRNVSPDGMRERRVTTPPGSTLFGTQDHWVYDRGGRPCLRCRTRIASRMHGDGLPRRTWWCPRCQPER